MSSKQQDTQSKQPSERHFLATDIRDALSQSSNEINGDEHVFTEDELMILIYGWVRHPKYPSPEKNTIYSRKGYKGEIWLSEDEIPSFASYVGYKLLKYLN